MKHKTWTFERNGSRRKIKYKGDHLLHILNENERRIEFLRFFESAYPNTTLEVDAEIFKLIVNEHTEPQDWAETWRYAWQFWKALDVSNIPEKEYTVRSNELVLKPFGVYLSRSVAWQDELVRSYEQALHQVFFRGLQTVGISLAVRKEIRDILWAALNHQMINLDLQDACVLFDYKKLETGDRWEVQSGMRGEFIEVKKRALVVGGWSNPREGGSKEVSWESVWYNPERVIPKAFRDKIPYLHKLLEATIVH